MDFKFDLELPNRNGEAFTKNDQFKEAFKYFKAKKKTPELNKVLDLHSDDNMLPNVEQISRQILSPEMERTRKGLELRPSEQWSIFSLKHHPGLIIICNAFNDLGAMTWIEQSLHYFSGHPHKTNLINLGLCSKNDSWWSDVKGSLARNTSDKRISQLRWATMGYHHNWDTKEYSDNDCSPMPKTLEELCRLLLYVVGYPGALMFKAEAAIVNYYPQGSTLNPHTDYSEPFKEAPLLSFSFGRSAVFLIGGRDKSTSPTPLFLHHGDIMIMGEESRLSYHAVPRILYDIDYENEFKLKKSWLHFINSFSLSIKKIKILENEGNEQILKEGKKKLGEVHHVQNIKERAESVERRFVSSDNKENGNETNFVSRSNSEDVEAALNYIRSYRINLNVRQVKQPDFR